MCEVLTISNSYPLRLHRLMEGYHYLQVGYIPRQDMKEKRDTVSALLLSER